MHLGNFLLNKTADLYECVMGYESFALSVKLTSFVNILIS